MVIKPILFNTDMVRAILDGRKTVTRRVVKPQPAGDGSAPEPLITRPGYWNAWGDDFVYRQPYQPGDILYVRETFFERKGKYYYKADGKHLALNAMIGGKEFFKWRPSIHMPKEAARIFLRVTDVRVERLQDIILEGCLKEGIPKEEITERDALRPNESARWIFEQLWSSTIKLADRAIYGWAANPWVWVIEFERISREEVKVCATKERPG